MRLVPSWMPAGDAEGSAKEVLDKWPQDAAKQDARADLLRWAMQQWAERGVLRINCGGEEYHTAEGVVWAADRFFTSGYKHGRGKPFEGPIANTKDAPLYQSARWFPVAEEPPGYRIPAPPGRYRLTLHLAEIHHRQPGRRSFGVIVEGQRLTDRNEPLSAAFATASQKQFTTTVRDGFLDLRFLHRLDAPSLNAVEVQRLVER